MGNDTQRGTETDDHSTTQGKLAAVISKYELTGLGDELVAYWTDESGDRMSLRELAEYVNQELIAAALRDSTAQTLDGDAANYYRLLRSDDVSSGTRVEAENRLEAHGIDAEELKADLVSRQAVHTYLTKERDVTYEEKSPSRDDRLQVIQRLKNRLVAVAEKTVTELNRSNDLSIGQPSVTVLVSVQCHDCNTQYSINELLSAGECDCAHRG